MLLISISALKNPVAHVKHFGCVVELPDAAVCLPAGHLVCWIHLSFDLAVLKYPGVHASQTLTLFLFKRTFSCVPGGQSPEIPGIIEIIIASWKM